MLKHRLAIVLISICFSLNFFALSALAVTVIHESNNSGHPGGEVRYNITIINDETRIYDFKLSSDDEYVHQFSDDEFTLLPSESIDVVYLQNIPANATAERHSSNISIQTKDKLIPDSDWYTTNQFRITTIVEIEAREVNSARDSSDILLIAMAAIIGIIVYEIFLKSHIRKILFLYFRRDPFRELNATEKNLVEGIKAEPGLTTAQLSRRLKKSRGTIVYTLETLEERELLQRGPIGGWFFNKYEGRLLKPIHHRILEELRNDNVLSQRMTAKKIGISQTALRYNLEKLKQYDFISSAED